MIRQYVATSTITIDAPTDRVWAVLTNRDAIKKFMFGTDIETEWTIGGPILWHGVYKGAAYEDKGVILELEPGRKLVTTHFSPLSGQEDAPENHHVLTWTLTNVADKTELTLSQDNNSTADEATHSKEMWDALLRSVKHISEQK